jgi:hypothetical protein
MLVGTVLADGTILSAGHGFWCNHDQNDPVLDPTVFVNGAAIVLNRQRTPNPAVQESMDLARVCPFPALSGGLVLAEKLPATTPDTLWTGQVWIVGYGRTGALETIAARVTNRDALYPGGTMEIRIKEPISPGLSGSPVLNAAGEVIGVVVAKSVEEPVIYATCVTRELIAELDRELWGAGGE